MIKRACALIILLLSKNKAFIFEFLLFADFYLPVHILLALVLCSFFKPEGNNGPVRWKRLQCFCVFENG
jgi:hypothetical protein